MKKLTDELSVMRKWETDAQTSAQREMSLQSWSIDLRKDSRVRNSCTLRTKRGVWQMKKSWNGRHKYVSVNTFHIFDVAHQHDEE